MLNNHSDPFAIPSSMTQTKSHRDPWKKLVLQACSIQMVCGVTNKEKGSLLKQGNVPAKIQAVLPLSSVVISRDYQCSGERIRCKGPRQEFFPMRKSRVQGQLRCEQQVSATKDDVQVCNEFSAWVPMVTKLQRCRSPAADPSPARSGYLLLAAQADLLAITPLRETLLSVQSP